MSRPALATPGGQTLALHDWPIAGRPRAVLQWVHGLGEHTGRYAHVARRLNEWGYAMRGHDHYGHGASSGPRGGLPEPMRLVDDLARVVDHSRTALPGVPLLLVGDSLGGLVAASFVARQLRPIEGLVLVSPALALALSPWHKLLLALLPRIAPGLRVRKGLDNCHLSHDPAVKEAFEADPLNHEFIGARLARFLADEGPRVLAAAPGWSVPTLLLYAGDDRLVDPAGSRTFAAAAPRDVVSATCFPALYHELFNELDATPVFDALQAWLARRFGSA